MGMANIPLTIKKRVSQKLMDKDEICDTLLFNRMRIANIRLTLVLTIYATCDPLALLRSSPHALAYS